MFHSNTNIQNNISCISPTRSKGSKFTDLSASHTQWLFSVIAGLQSQHWRLCCGKVAGSQEEEKEPLNKINIFLCLYVQTDILMGKFYMLQLLQWKDDIYLVKSYEQMVWNKNAFANYVIIQE